MRPLGIRSKAVRHNNLSLIRHFGNPNETLLPFLGSYLSTVDRVSEDMAAKIRYLWQDTLEDLATDGDITEDTLNRAWILVSTPSKPDVPDTIKKLFAKSQPVAEPAKAPSVSAAPKPDYDKFLDDVDADTTAPTEARKTSNELTPDDLDIKHDTFDTYASIFRSNNGKKWPYIGVFNHEDIGGKVIAVGQLSGHNENEHMVYKGCMVGDESFTKLGAICEFERKGAKDSTYRIRIFKLRPCVVKFWVNVDDPSRPERQRDIEHLYRYVEVTASGVIREINSVGWQALKNALQAN